MTMPPNESMKSNRRRNFAPIVGRGFGRAVYDLTLRSAAVAYFHR